MNGNNRISLPGQVNTQIVIHPGPLSHPHSVSLQKSPQDLQLNIHGGLTKLEYVASRIASAIVAANPELCGDPPENVKDVSRGAIAVAEQLLRDCEARLRGTPTGQ